MCLSLPRYATGQTQSGPTGQSHLVGLVRADLPEDNVKPCIREAFHIERVLTPTAPNGRCRWATCVPTKKMLPPGCHRGDWARGLGLYDIVFSLFSIQSRSFCQAQGPDANGPALGHSLRVSWRPDQHTAVIVISCTARANGFLSLLPSMTSHGLAAFGWIKQIFIGACERAMEIGMRQLMRPCSCTTPE